MLPVIFVLVYVCLSGCTAVIYHLNKTEHSQIPPLYEMDDYETCLMGQGAMYCVLDGDLFSSNNSKLMNLIYEYSADTKKHYNYTQVHRALCVTTTCREFIGNLNVSNTHDLNIVLSECLNHTIWNKYKIESKLANVYYCENDSSKLSFDISDIIVAIVYIILILLNITGSLYDVLKFEKNDDSGNPYLLSFSIRRNWSKLTRPSGGSDPRLNRLKLFNGFRTMTMVCVILSHIVLAMAMTYVDNPYFIETLYENPLTQIPLNGTLVTLTFFMMSSFLLAYHFELNAEKHGVTWLQFPKGMILRWLRLTPTYALMLATVCTWMRRIGGGPLWQLLVDSEAAACRTYWWAHLLYINNYIYDNFSCAPQTWYLASDTQMFAAGLLLCVLARTRKARIVTLVALLIASLAITAAQTYFADLDAVIMQSPESFRSLYAHNDTFRLQYIRAHTTFCVYVLGLGTGFLTYHWQTEGVTFQHFKKYRLGYWLFFPLGLALMMSGVFFYSDGDRASIATRVLYSTFLKPVFEALLVCGIIGSIFKIESVYRGILEWRGFTWMSRLSYSAFLLHTLFPRVFIGLQTRPIHFYIYYVVILLASMIFLTYMAAAVLWVCVEAPFTTLTKYLLSPRKKEQTKV